MEQTGFPDAWDVESGRKRHICDGFESWLEKLTRRRTLLSAEIQRTLVCLPTSGATPSEGESQHSPLELQFLALEVADGRKGLSKAAAVEIRTLA